MNDAIADIIVEVPLSLDRGHTWEFFFNQINIWWPKEFYTSSRTKRFTIDTFIGGKMYEDFGEGDGLVWGNVIGCDFLHSLDIRGHLIRAFGGPLTTLERFELIDDQKGTILKYSCDLIGQYKDSTKHSLTKGWNSILVDHFFTYCARRDSL